MRPFLLGLLLALAGLGPYPSPFTPPPRPGPGAWWVADRAANTVWLLDADLIAVAGYRLCGPVELLPDGEGGVWVFEALEGTPRGLHRVRRLGCSGARGPPWMLEPPLALRHDEGSGPLVLTRAGALLRLETDGPVDLGRYPGASGLRRVDGELLVEAGVGALRLDGTPAAGLEGWGLDHRGRLLQPGGGPVPLGFDTPALVRGPGTRTPWILDRRGDRLRRLDPDARGWITARGIGRVVGFEAGWQRRDGVVLVSALGSLQLFGPDGRLRAAQGGFRDVVSVAPAAGSGRRSSSSRRGSGPAAGPRE